MSTLISVAHSVVSAPLDLANISYGRAILMLCREASPSNTKVADSQARASVGLYVKFSVRLG